MRVVHLVYRSRMRSWFCGIIIASMLDFSVAELTSALIFKNLKRKDDRVQCVWISRDASLSNLRALKLIETENAERDLILWFGEKIPWEYARTRLEHSVEIIPLLAYDVYSLPAGFANEAREYDDYILSREDFYRYVSVEYKTDNLKRVYNVEQERTDLDMARLLLEIWMNRVFTERMTLLLSFKYWMWRQMYAKPESKEYFESLMDRVPRYLSHDLKAVFDKVVFVFSLHVPFSEDAQKRLSDDFDFISKKMVDHIPKDSEFSKKIATHDMKSFIWIRDNCFDPPSSPQLNYLLKKVAGKVLLYANLENYHKYRAIKYFSRAISGFSEEDVHVAWTSSQTITIPPDADVDFVVREMLAGDPSCNRSCVERFLNWAMDELKKGTTSKEFVIAVRNLLRG